MRKILKIRTYAFLQHDLSIKLFFIVHFPPSFNLNGNKKVWRFCNWIYAETPHDVALL